MLVNCGESEDFWRTEVFEKLSWTLQQFANENEKYEFCDC